MSGRFDAIIFDCDGVLVNSEEVAQQVELSCLAEIGLQYQRDDFVRRFSGMSTAGFRDAISKEHIDKLGEEIPTGFFDYMFSGVVSAYEKELGAIDGAVEFARSWENPKAVASSGSPDLITMKLAKAGLGQIFGNYVFCSQDFKPKPSPDVFLFAAGKLGIPPSGCLVIEDSVSGVIAGKEAGMTVVGFIGGGHCSEAHDDLLRDNGADWISSSFDDIARRIDHL